MSLVKYFLEKGAEVNWKAPASLCVGIGHVPMMTALTTEKEGMEEVVDLLFRSGFKGEER